MEKSVFTPEYEALRRTLVRLREGAGLTQRDLAKKMKRPRSFVSRIEQGERRVDLVEMWWLCRTCGSPFEATVRKLSQAWHELERAGRRQSRRAP